MNRTIRLLIGGLVVFLCGHVSADTLICRDGRELSGEVKQTATGYVIKTKVAEFELRSDEVKEWTIFLDARDKAQG